MNENDKDTTSITQTAPENTDDVETVEAEVIEPGPEVLEQQLNSLDDTQTEGEIHQIEEQIKSTLKLYKLTMWIVVALIALYLLCLFVFKRGALLVCIPMIIAAVFNTKYSRKIQKLANERAVLKKKLEQSKETVEGVDESGNPIITNAAEPIVTDMQSLNELPKEYTVLDDIEFDDGTAQNVIVSPYGVAVVGPVELRDDVNVMLQELGIESPVFIYSPDQEIAQLGEEIQMEKTPVLDEVQIMKILQKLIGVK